MLISLNWVRDHCPFKTSDDDNQIGVRFSMHTAEVEKVEMLGSRLGEFVAARVLEVHAVEGADRLRRVLVEHGEGEPAQVICGAPNVREGMVAPFARLGTEVLGKKLREAKIRGVVSRGMLLAEDELEISADHTGLMELPAEVTPGTPVSEVFPRLRDILLEVDNKSLTHRPDLWGHYGIAREFSLLYGEPLKPYAVDERLTTCPGKAGIEVSILEGEASSRCRRYCGLRIDGVRIGPSPEWLRQQLLAVGSRPINNIVDITNYILFDLGQPLHAFDSTRVQGGAIIVRMPEPGETLTLLDGRTIELHEEDLVIADGNRAVALAGVMGGEDSEITEDTVSVFLESANFDPTSVRRSSIRHGRTESSARFEKSIDPAQARLGILKAAEMILEFCPDAKVVGPLQDVGFKPPDPIVIELSSNFIPRRLGADLSTERTRDILTGLGFEVEETNSDAAKIGIDDASWLVTVPSWRATRDVSIREDLVEEVGRIFGYDQIVPSAPSWPVTAPEGNERRRLERQIKSFLTFNCSLDEVMTYSMVGASHCEFFQLDPDAHLKLRNSMSEEMDRMRREIIPMHLEKTRENQRFLDRFGFFEMGRVYLKDRDQLLDPELPDERTRIAGVLAFAEKTAENFYELRRIVLSLLDSLQLEDVTLQPLENQPAWGHPHVGAIIMVGKLMAGRFYRVHPEYIDRLELRGDILAFDLDFEVIAGAPLHQILYENLPRYPGVPFDVAVVAADRTPVGEIIATIRKCGSDLLRRVEVFDVYRGKGIEEGQKSIALQLEFRADDHTLDADEVESLQTAVIEGLENAGYPLRR